MKSLFSSLLALGFSCTAFLAGCSPHDNSVGSDGNNLKGDQSCTKGDTKKADDGCNNCVCDANGEWACTLLGCEVGGHGGTAGAAGSGAGGTGGTGTGCKDGDTKPSDDGCNSCTCTANGWACTEKACAPIGGSGGTSAGGTSGSGGTHAGQCQSASDCAVDAICEICSDGSCAGRVPACVAGQCQSHSGCASPAPECKNDGECVAPAVCAACADGSSSCAAAACVAGTCQTNFPACDGTCHQGDTKTAPDGCNLCSCQADGQWVCTEKACGKACDGESTKLQEQLASPEASTCAADADCVTWYGGCLLPNAPNCAGAYPVATAVVNELKASDAALSSCRAASGESCASCDLGLPNAVCTAGKCSFPKSQP